MTAAADMIHDLQDAHLMVRFELRKHLRRKRLYIAFGIAIALPMLFLIIPLLFGRDFADTAKSFASSNLNFISTLIIISGAIFAGDSVSSEFERKTGLMLFPTPQRRTSIFIGKYVAALLALFAVVTFYYLITVGEIVSIYGMSEIPMEIGKSFLMAILYSTSVMSVMFFFSSVMKRTITSSLIGFFLLMMIMPILTMILTAVDVDPWFMLTQNASLISDVLAQSSGGFGPMNHGGPDQARFNTYSPDFLLGSIVITAYTMILLWIGLYIANRRRME